MNTFLYSIAFAGFLYFGVSWIGENRPFLFTISFVAAGFILGKWLV